MITKPVLSVGISVYKPRTFDRAKKFLGINRESVLCEYVLNDVLLYPVAL